MLFEYDLMEAKYNIFDKNIVGLWLPYLPLVINSASSLQKGIRIFNTLERDLNQNPPSACGECSSRIGLVGNPSDGYFGNVISVECNRFKTTVSLVQSSSLTVLPHPM